MRLKPLIHLLGLRYRLLWAQTRTRNGKVVLLVVAYLALSAAAALLTLGGLGAAIASIRLGKAELVARVALTAPFLCATLAATVLGVGMNPVFSDGSLRRYALSRLERLASRHLITLLEPLWILTFALDVGLAAGFALLGIVPWLAGISTALLLLMVNYLLARVLLILVERAMATRAGPFLIVTAVAILFPLPAAAGLLLAHNQALLGSVLAVFKLTPPFAAAAVMAGAPSWASAGWMLVLLAYCAGLAAAVAVLERLPAPSRVVPGAHAVWDEPWDRIAAFFGPELGPLIGKILRYYIRSPQLRLNYPLAVPGGILMAVVFGFGDPTRSSLSALGAITGVGSMSMGVMTMNVFGFDGSGFRRYFLVPVAPTKVLLAAGIVPLILGSALVPVWLGAFIAVSRAPVDIRILLMLLSNGFGSVFLFQALGLWTSLLAPRAIEFNATWGNKLSLGANALMAGGIFMTFGLISLFGSLGLNVVLAYWWMAPLAALVAAGFYLFTMKKGTAVFCARRERMLSSIERGY
jgi:hypothetical protein